MNEHIIKCNICGKSTELICVEVCNMKTFKVIGHAECGNTQGNWFNTKQEAIEDWEKRNG